MRPRAILFAAATLALASVASLRSQAQAPQPQSSIEVVTAMQAANKKIIEQQAQTLETLKEMQKTAEQIKIFSKRT